MILFSRSGVRVATSDEHGEFLIQHLGYRKADAKASAPVAVADEKPAAPKRTRRTTKTTD